MKPALPLLIVLEGIHDIHFLKAIGSHLHKHHPSLPDLATLEPNRQVIFLPTGGSNLADWAPRIAGLGRREFHLYDREVEPETSRRRAVVQNINQRPGCIARLTKRRALENYLHPIAITEACGIHLRFDDNDDVTSLLASRFLKGGTAWNQLSFRMQKRLRDKAKRLLNYRAVQAMTLELLHQQDREGEVLGWFGAIGRLMQA